MYWNRKINSITESCTYQSDDLPSPLMLESKSEQSLSQVVKVREQRNWKAKNPNLTTTLKGRWLNMNWPLRWIDTKDYDENYLWEKFEFCSSTRPLRSLQSSIWSDLSARANLQVWPWIAMPPSFHRLCWKETTSLSFSRKLDKDSCKSPVPRVLYWKALKINPCVGVKFQCVEKH